jgi:hypothetical protein
VCVRVRVRVCVRMYVWVCRFAVPLYRFAKLIKNIDLLGTKCGTDWYETDLLVRGRVRRGDPGVRARGWPGQVRVGVCAGGPGARRVRVYARAREG